MEFLVRIEVRWPPDGDPAELERLRAAEQERARELASAGTIVRLWRIPGLRDWGLWRADDATALHAAIASLRLYPWVDATVHPLAAHPSDPVTGA